MRTVLCCVLYIMAGLYLPAAQQTKNPPHIHREPSDLARLSYFVGAWVLEAKIEKTTTSSGGEFQQFLTVEWMKGEHFLVSRTETKGQLGDTSGLVVTGFDLKAGKFVYHSFDSTGGSEHGTGTVDGKTWTWVSEPPEPDVRVQRRFRLTELTPDEYSFILEITPDGNSWATAMQGKARKQH